jgi:hypothetical protein
MGNVMPVIAQKKRRRSERGNWLVVTYIDGRIFWCKWVGTWAGVQMSKRNAEQTVANFSILKRKGRVIVMDIERMADFAVTEGANEIHDLYRLFEKE